MVFKLELSNHERYWPIFSGKIGSGLMLQDKDSYRFILENKGHLKAKLAPNYPSSIGHDLLDCDIYFYGHFPLFSARAFVTLNSMRCFTECLTVVSIAGRTSPLYLFSANGGIDCISAESEFQIKGETPLFLVHAKFFEGMRLNCDIFWMKHPGYDRYLRETFVTERFRQTWESAELVGAKFTEVGNLPDDASD